MKKLLAILQMRCPQCYKGKLYLDSNPYKIGSLHRMPANCPCCGQSFDPEPGFYIGAMYVSYALCVGLFLFCFFSFYIFMHVEAISLLIIYALALLALFPLIFRYSRTIYLHLFYDYDPEAIERYQSQKPGEKRVK